MNVAQRSDEEVTRLADVIYVFIERQRVVDRDSQTSRTLLTRLTLTQPRSTVLPKPSIRFRVLVPLTMASVLSGFIDKPLRSSQC